MDKLEVEGMNDNNGHNLTPVISMKDFILILVCFLSINLVCCLLAKKFCSDEFIELMKMLLFFDVLTVIYVICEIIQLLLSNCQSFQDNNSQDM